MSSTNEETTTTDLTNPCCCSLYVTGPRPVYQAIFVCDTCCSQDDGAGVGMCVCEACANHCHEWHDELNYVAMGQAYCDCDRLLSGRCKLREASLLTVQQWDLHPPLRDHVPPRPLSSDASSSSLFRFVMNVFSIPELYQNALACNSLITEAMELVQHSKETFWLSNNHLDSSRSSASWLELMAWRIFDQHRHLYGMEMQDSGGAEWWVQVKETKQQQQQQQTEETSNNQDNQETEAVDLHFDKDEALAEKFSLGAFPTLSTVTYLTENSNPTVILERTYDQDDDEVIPAMMLSHPRRGKHLVFDGRLLHGAPSHPDLRNTYHPSLTAEDDNQPPSHDGSGSTLRVTLLVNVWNNRKPAGVNPLPPEVRAAMMSKHQEQTNHGTLPSARSEFSIQTIEEVLLQEEIMLKNATDDNNKEMLHRIELPFVCKGITWESEDDESTGLVLVTCPPPRHHHDTIYIKFGAGLQAYLDRQVVDKDYQGDPSMVENGGYEEAYL